MGNFTGIETSPLLEETVEALTRIVGASQCFIYLASSDHQVFTPLMSRGQVSRRQQEVFFSGPLSANTDVLIYEILSRRPALRSYNVSYEPWLSPSLLITLEIPIAIVLPIRSGEQVLGLYVAGIPDEPSEFTPSHLEMAGFAANSLALALENARLYQETRQRLEESQSLHQIALALLQKLTLEETLEILCSEAQRLTNAQGASVSLLEDPCWLRVAYRTGETPFGAPRFPVNDSLSGLAVRRGEPLLINNQPTQDDDGQPGASFSLLAVPLTVKGTINGVLDVIKQHGFFTDDDARVISLFADQASVAIEHARLVQEAGKAAILEERQRLSRDLHDSVNQNLYGINLYSQAALRQLEQGNREAAESHLKNVQRSAQDALGEMRLLIFELRPPVLESEGLAAALEARLKSVEERTGLKAGLKARLPERLLASVEDELYRIAQEALNNVLKHAQANQVTIHLIQSGRTLLMRIEDDGVGFDPDDETMQGKLGLKAMAERARMLNGQMTIDSAPGMGTRILVEVRS